MTFPAMPAALTLLLLLLPSPAAPEAMDDIYPQQPTGPTTVTVPITRNDTIPCSPQAVLSIKDGPLHGSVKLLPSGTIEYEPQLPAGMPNKDDQFTYQVGGVEGFGFQGFQVE